MKKKKEIEHFYLVKFLALLGKVADEILPEESPDFIVVLKQKR